MHANSKPNGCVLSSIWGRMKEKAYQRTGGGRCNPFEQGPEEINLFRMIASFLIRNQPSCNAQIAIPFTEDESGKASECLYSFV